MSNKKAQSAIEFVVLVGFALFFFVSFLLVVQISTSDKARLRIDTEVKNIGLTIQDEISLAHSSSEGYQRVFHLPIDIYGLDYSAEIRGTSVYIITADEKHALDIPILNATGYFMKGDNLITKKNGLVQVN